MKQLLRLAHGKAGHEPIILTWSLFLWGYVVPMLIFTALIIGSFVWLTDQNTHLEQVRDELTRQNQRGDRLLCERTAKNEVFDCTILPTRRP